MYFVMCTVSVIIPFYDGNKYLENLKTCLEACCRNFDQKVQVVVINDSPHIEIDKAKLTSNKYELVIINHEQNEGIHHARVTGVQNARGEYVLFLDQDDNIDKNFFKEMLSILEKNELLSFVFANGTFVDSKGKKKIILNSYGKVLGAQNYRTYIKVGNLLASPGQCLIRKEKIPSIWTKNIMKTNCADDYLLWILLLKDANATFVNKVLYYHISTGVNVSADKLNGYKSDLEVCDILRKEEFLTSKEMRLLELRCRSNYAKEKGEQYSLIQFIRTKSIEKIERLKMKIIGCFFSMFGKKIKWQK